MINTFWEEFDYFHSKTGPYENREYIWVSGDIQSGASHIWHSKNSLRYTKVLGKLACRACSKILGIGSAERAWGDVKHLKTNKRSHISGDRVKKQATIYGSHCVTLSKMHRDHKAEEYKEKPYKFWLEEDMDKEFDIFFQDKKKEPKKIKFFKAWEEEWEVEAVKKRDPVNEAKLLEKYGGLQFFDPDKNKTYLSSDKSVRWHKEIRKPGVYCIICYDEDYQEGQAEEEDDEHVEMWLLSEDLRYCIAEYYKKNKDKGVKVIELKDGEENEE
jgi:hypothetical protein